MNFWLALGLMCPLLFLQNMAFTWSSRSRNSGDVRYHWLASIASNGIYIVTQTLLLANLWKAVSTTDIFQMSVLFVVYTLITSAGSVFMMKRLLKSETGKRKVGAA